MGLRTGSGLSPLQKYMKDRGRLPPVRLIIRPLDSARPQYELRDFLTYQFSSSILIPVDTFSFTFTNPQANAESFLDFVQEGDVAVLVAGEGQAETTLATGIVDMIDIETTESGGEVVTVQGRDLMAQLEDQTAVSIKNLPLPSGNYSPAQVIGYLAGQTRITKYRLQGLGSKAQLFASEPGETKLTALQRYLDPLNCVAWMDPDGTLVLGKPDMGSTALGTFVCDRTGNQTNVMNIKSTRASTQIANIIVPIWSGQETVQFRLKPEQLFYNKGAEKPFELLRLGHLLPKAYVVSTPAGGGPQDLAEINRFIAASSNILQAYAKREVARENVKENIVQVVVPGHFNELLQPFAADTCYQIRYPRARIDERMYLFEVSYEMEAERGPRTRLTFCKTGRIVADTPTSALDKSAANKRTVAPL